MSAHVGTCMCICACARAHKPHATDGRSDKPNRRIEWQVQQLVQLASLTDIKEDQAKLQAMITKLQKKRGPIGRRGPPG